MDGINIIALMGPPDSGKGTHTQEVIELEPVYYLSTGAFCRELAERKEELGNKCIIKSMS